VVGVLIRMKLRVLRHSLRGGRGVAYGIGICWGVLAGVFTAVLIGAYPGSVTVGTDIASALIAVWTLGWLFGPILTGGGDETLRPEKLRAAAHPAGRAGQGAAGRLPRRGAADCHPAGVQRSGVRRAARRAGRRRGRRARGRPAAGAGHPAVPWR